MYELLSFVMMSADIPKSINHTYESITTIETTTAPTTKFISNEETEAETTIQPMADATETFTFDVEGEPDTDLAFSIVRNSDGLKFESYSLLESNNTSNISNQNVSLTEIKDDGSMIMNSTSIDETSSLFPTTTPISSVAASETTENHDLMFDNATETTDTETGSTVAAVDNINYSTAPPTLETETKPDTVNESLSDVERYENFTDISETELDTAPMEDSMMKMHLTSEELTVLPNNSRSQNITDCGLWVEDSGIINNSNIQDFLIKWSALGYLQMFAEPKTCLSAAISPSFVITSLNCLTFSDRDLDPDKWTYIDGLHQSNATNSRTQNQAINKIIPYPGVSLFLNEHDMALVRVKNATQIDEYSENVCVAEKVVEAGKECFTIGWTIKVKQYSDAEFQKQYYSVPLSIISSEECNNTMNFNGMLIGDLICGVRIKEKIPACFMDLGSPLVCLNEYKRWEIQGVLNFPSPCDTPQPTVFNSVASIKEWIAKILTNDEKLPE